MASLEQKVLSSGILTQKVLTQGVINVGEEDIVLVEGLYLINDTDFLEINGSGDRLIIQSRE